MCLIGIYILYLSVNNKYEMRPIFLIGYMGSGKTTLGRALGRRLGLQFIDLDLYIESRYMRTISQLFAERGEDKFRSIEREMLHEVAEMEDVVVACGGGTPCYYDNIDYMNRCGTTVFLSASEDRLFARLSINRNKRPLIKDLDDKSLRIFIRENLALRMPHYSKASHSFCGDRLEDVMQISTSVEKFIKEIVIR